MSLYKVVNGRFCFTRIPNEKVETYELGKTVDLDKKEVEKLTTQGIIGEGRDGFCLEKVNEKVVIEKLNTSSDVPIKKVVEEVKPVEKPIIKEEVKLVEKVIEPEVIEKKVEKSNSNIPKTSKNK